MSSYLLLADECDSCDVDYFAALAAAAAAAETEGTAGGGGEGGGGEGGAGAQAQRQGAPGTSAGVRGVARVGGGARLNNAADESGSAQRGAEVDHVC